MKYNPLKWPISFSAALLVNIFYYTLLIPGMVTYPNYNPFTHDVSAIGSITINPGWYFFSLCLILIGFTFLPFYFGLNTWYEDEPKKKKLIRIVQILGIVDSVTLIMIALYPTDTHHPQHEFWSIMDFVFIISTILALSIALWNHPKFNKQIACYGFFTCGICLSYGILAAVYEGISIIEHLSFMLALSYALVVGIKMFVNISRESTGEVQSNCLET